MSGTDRLDKVVQLLNLNTLLAGAAQEALDDHDWDTGGACDAIAMAFGGVLAEHGFDFRDGGHDGDDHAWLVVEIPDGPGYMLDLPSSHYETGGGYAWQPLPDIDIMPDDILIEPMNW